MLERTTLSNINLSVRTMISIGLMLAIGFDAAAQRRGPPAVGRMAVPTVTGQVAHPFGAAQPALPGYGYGAGGRPFGHRPSSTGAVGVIPYIVPVPAYVGDSYQQAAPPVEDPSGMVDPQPVPPAVIAGAPPYNRPPPTTEGPPPNAGPPIGPERGCTQPAQEDPVQFFIALKDGWVHVAVAYWVLQGTLHYLTPEGSHNRVSLEIVDREMSARLNDGGRVPFVLPP